MLAAADGRPWAVAAAALLVLAGCRPHTSDVPLVLFDAGPGGPAPALAPPPDAGRATPHVYRSGGPESFAPIVEDARAAVVAIRATSPIKNGPAAMFPGASPSGSSSIEDVAAGTGFLIEAQGVHVLTTDTIAAAAPQLVVALADGREVPATVIGRDPRLGIALLAIDVPRLGFLPLGDSDDLEVGEWVVALGNPFGTEVTASAGIVSATGRGSAAVPARSPAYRAFLQTDARIHRGNSGGPLLDVAGKVVGVALATGDRPGEVGFAVPINRVREILPALRAYGAVARSWLGVYVRPVTADYADRVALPRAGGALVTGIEAGSPAAAAGLRAGDVILSWQGDAIDHQSLPWKVASTPVGTRIDVAVWRAGAEHRLAVTTEKMPE